MKKSLLQIIHEREISNFFQSGFVIRFGNPPVSRSRVNWLGLTDFRSDLPDDFLLPEPSKALALPKGYVKATVIGW